MFRGLHRLIYNLWRIFRRRDVSGIIPDLPIDDFDEMFGQRDPFADYTLEGLAHRLAVYQGLVIPLAHSDTVDYVKWLEWATSTIASQQKWAKVRELAEAFAAVGGARKLTFDEMVVPSGLGPGAIIDDPKSPFLKREWPLINYLSSQSKEVRRIPDDNSRRTADAFVDGVKTEFKKLEPGATSATVLNRVKAGIRGAGQARVIIIDARGTGLRDVDALDGLRDVARSPGYVAKLDSVTVVGDGYEVIRRFP